MSALDAISTEAREVLLEALMSVAGADRTLADEERQAAQAAAMGLGLVLPGDRDLTSPDRKPSPPEDLEGLAPGHVAPHEGLKLRLLQQCCLEALEERPGGWRRCARCVRRSPEAPVAAGQSRQTVATAPHSSRSR